MSKQRTVSETHNISDLFTECRYFPVAAHHRDYAWRTGENEAYLDDVVDGLYGSSKEYFLRLIF
jgi:hypothetical protein